MACIEKRTYLPVPQLIGTNIPPVPTDPGNWQGIATFLNAVKQTLAGEPPNQVKPGKVTNFVSTVKLSGNLLTWDPEPISEYYILYRGLSNDFTKAFAIAVISRGSGLNFSFFDACGQDADGTVLFYWIQPYTGFAVAGPLSFTLGVSSECCSGTGCADTFFDSFTGGAGGSLMSDNYFSTYNQFILGGGNSMLHITTGTSGQECCLCLGAPGLIGSTSQYMGIIYLGAGTGSRDGFGVYMSGTQVTGVGQSGMQGYWAMLFPGTINLFGSKVGSPNYTLAAGIGSPTINDQFEIQADLSGSGANRVRLWQNNVLLADIMDSDANKPQAYGVPGFGMLDNGSGPGSLYTNLQIRPTR